MTSTLAALPHAKVASTRRTGPPDRAQFVSANGHETYAVLELAGAGDARGRPTTTRSRTSSARPACATQVGGLIPTDEAINKQVTADIGRAEGFSMPVLLILMLVIFGSLAAASLPLAIGGIAILGSFTALRLLTLVTAVSVYSLNITTILGLGLGIDYGLFLVSRFREELRRQDSVEDAVARTVATAGRTVVVSGITVAMALASLMLFPETFLRSMGYGGVATVLVDMLAALTVHARAAGRARPEGERAADPPLPAARLASTGGRTAGPSAPPGPPTTAALVPARAQRDAPPGALRRPDRGAAARARLTVPAGHLGRDRRHRAAGQRRAAGGHRGAEPRLPRQPDRPDRGRRQVPRPGRRLARRAGRARLVRPAASATFPASPARRSPASAGISPGWTCVTARPYSPQARAIVGQVRGVAPPAGARAYVGGQTAQLVDELSSLGRTLPWMALVVALATFVLLFLAFGSLVLPVKAIVMNVLSLSAMYGVVVWIFQDGHLSGLLQLHPERHHRPDHADPDVRDHVRAVHGLRGVPAVPDPRAVRPHRRQHRRGRGRAAAHRRRHHQRRRCCWSSSSARSPPPASRSSS